MAPDWRDPEEPKLILRDDPVAIRRPAPRRDKAQDVITADAFFDESTMQAKPPLMAVYDIGAFTVTVE